MQRMIFIYKHFVSQPLWFKLLIIASLVATVLFSSSYYSDHDYYPSVAKLAAALFFTAYGISFRSNKRLAVIFFGAASLCVLLSLIYLM